MSKVVLSTESAFVHRQQDGFQILIAQMSDDHLINTIMVVTKQLRAARELAQKARQVAKDYEHEMEEAEREFGINTMFNLNPQQFHELVRVTWMRVGPYVTEIVLRGDEENIAQVREHLRVVFNRDKQLGLDLAPLLPE